MVAGTDDPVFDEAVARARAGDAEAFAEVYRRVSRRVLGLCLHLLGSREDAEDATSEVFMKVRAAMDRYNPSLPFRPWLIGITTKHCLDRLRRRRRDARVFEPDREPPLEAAVGHPSPLARLLAAEQQRALSGALASLPEQQRVPLVLRYHAEMSYDEIASHLGWTRERVAVSLFRAKQRLRRALAGENPRP